MTCVENNGICSTFKRKFCEVTLTEIAFMAMLTLTEYLCNLTLDLPGSLQNALMKNYDLSASQFSLFYTLYYVPSILINGFSGFLIDSVLGIRLSIIIYSVVGLAGCVIFNVGGIFNMFWLMLMGRLIFGLGNEMATGVCTNYCLFAWYRNSLVNLASSLNVNGSLAGTITLYQVGPRLIQYFKRYMPEKESLNLVLGIASGTYVITSASAIILSYLKPKNVENQINRTEESEANTSNTSEEKKATLKDILEFPAVFWFLNCVNSFNYMVSTFSQFSQGLLTQSDFNMTVDEASNAVTVMNVANIVVSIPVSLSVDIIGRNTWYITIAQIFGIIAYIMLLLRTNPYVSMMFVGVCTSVFQSAILPMYAYPLEKHLIGSCYGINSAIGGISLTLSPYIVGKVIDAFDYRGAIYFYLIVSSASLVCILAIWYLDKRATGILSMSPGQRLDYERTMEMRNSADEAVQEISHNSSTATIESTNNLSADFSSSAIKELTGNQAADLSSRATIESTNNLSADFSSSAIKELTGNQAADLSSRATIESTNNLSADFSSRAHNESTSNLSADLSSVASTESIKNQPADLSLRATIESTNNLSADFSSRAHNESTSNLSADLSSIATTESIKNQAADLSFRATKESKNNQSADFLSIASTESTNSELADFLSIATTDSTYNQSAEFSSIASTESMDSQLADYSSTANLTQNIGN